MNAIKLIVGTLCAIALFSPERGDASTLNTLYSVAGSSDGSYPVAALIKVGGALYGTTQYGGIFQQGVIYKLDPTSGTATVVYTFTGKADGGQPLAALTYVGGTIFGVASSGGAYSAGTLFKVDPATGAQSVLHSFGSGDDGSFPSSSLLANGGFLYGLTPVGGTQGGGTVFRIDPTTGAEIILHAFSGDADGEGPTGLIESGGELYGTTTAGGTDYDGIVFKIDPSTGAETILHTLTGASEGSGPTGLTEVDGSLVVTVANGGAAGGGTVIKVDPATGAESLLYAFEGGIDGARPQAAVIKVGSLLYGTTQYGGASNLGSVFKLNPASGKESVIHSFAGSQDGDDPLSSLLSFKGTLFGTARNGGAYDSGTVFSIDPASDTLALAHSFPPNSSNFTGEGLLSAKSGIYLTQGQGGPLNRGAIVQIAPSNGDAKLVAGFADPAGAAVPLAPLIRVGGAFYGTSVAGGTAGVGTAFALDPVKGAVTVLHSFSGGSDGQYPAGPLFSFAKALFGATDSGGANADGTLFKIDPATGTETQLYAFGNGNDGQYPSSGLIYAQGSLFGTTDSTIFKYNPTTGTTTTLYTLNQSGLFSAHGLVKSGSLLYGTATYGGAYQAGAVFSFNPANSSLQVLYSFSGGSDGGYPAEPLTAVQGSLYGTAKSGGSSGYGTIFGIDLTSGAETLLYTFTDGGDGGYPCAPLIAIGTVLYGGTCSGGAQNLGTVFSLQP